MPGVEEERFFQTQELAFHNRLHLQRQKRVLLEVVGVVDAADIAPPQLEADAAAEALGMALPPAQLLHESSERAPLETAVATVTLAMPGTHKHGGYGVWGMGYERHGTHRLLR